MTLDFDMIGYVVSIFLVYMFIGELMYRNQTSVAVISRLLSPSFPSFFFSHHDHIRMKPNTKRVGQGICSVICVLVISTMIRTNPTEPNDQSTKRPNDQMSKQANDPREPRDWRPKWSAIPSDELEVHFTDYEVSSMKAMEALAKLPSFNKSDISRIERDHPCDVGFIDHHAANGYAPISCCLGSSLHWVGNVKELGIDNRCYEGQYDIRMDIYLKQRALTTHDLFRILPNDSKMVFIGDSVTRQVQDGFICDVIRENVRGDDPDIEIDTKSRPFRSKEYSSHQPSYDESAIFRSIQDGDAKVLSLDFWDDGKPDNLWKYSDLCGSHDVVVFNWGLHVKYPNTEWVDGIFGLLQDCFDDQSVENRPLFIWKEANSQHFESRVGGFYEDIYGANQTLRHQWRQHTAELEQDPELLTNDTKWRAYFEPKGKSVTKCGPHRYFQDQAFERHVKRQAIIEGVRSNAKLTFNLEIVYPDRPVQGQRENTLYFIPFKDVTDPLWGMHRGGSGQGDCTHVCHTPFMWEVVWDSMAKIAAKNQD